MPAGFLKTRLYLIAAVILFVGLSSAVLIYFTATDDSGTSLIDEFEGSKRYKHDLEVYGGKWNVVANDFINWFEGLWQGKTLAFTIAVIASVIAFGFFFVARRLPPTSKSDKKGESNQGTGTTL